MRRFPWIRLRKKTDPELPFEPPIHLGNFSTGEYFHEQTPRERLIRRMILERAEAQARRLGVDRREFLASAAGMATSLGVLNVVSGCGSDGRRGGGGAADGGFNVPDAAAGDCELAEDILDTSGEFIFDIQTHHIEREGDWRKTNPESGPTIASYFASFNGCSQAADKIDCIDADAYIEKIFLESDTTVAVLSGFPTPICTEERTTGCGNPLDNDAIARSRDRVNALARSERVLNHCQVNPSDQLDLQLALMERVHAQYGVAGWKVYPPWGPDGPGWFLDDPKVGIPFIEKARALGAMNVCIHKGIVFPGWDAEAADPRDVGVVAKMFPDVNFIVYHSGIELGAAGEGPYNPEAPAGTDRLIKTVLDNELGAGSNVYAELGSVWAQVFTQPDVAQHVIGKLLLHLGEDNVLWGSECVWLGSPQPQIEAFRTFEISTELQEKHGYPAMTPERKAKILGLSAARVYGIDPEATRCRIRAAQLGRLKQTMDGELGPRRWAFQRMGGPRTRREWFDFIRVTGGKPG
jgi:uncharacterized protein